MLQLRRLHTRRRRPHRIADQPGVPGPQPVESALVHAGKFDARSPRRTGRRRFVRLHPDDVQRRRTGRLQFRQDRQAAPPADTRGTADLVLERHLPPHRGAGSLGARLHLLLARQQRPHHRHHQAGRRQDERRGRHSAGRRAGDSAGRGLDSLLLDLPARAVPPAADAEHRISEGRPQRAAADSAQTGPAQNPAGDQLRPGDRTLRPLQEQPAGRHFGRGIRDARRRQACRRAARRRHGALPPHPPGQPADAGAAAIVAGRIPRASP